MAASKSAATTEAPASVPRPSLAPQAAAPAATEEAKPRRQRRHTRHQHRRYAHWQPFPIYWPRLHGHRITWSRISWFSRF